MAAVLNQPISVIHIDADDSDSDDNAEAGSSLADAELTTIIDDDDPMNDALVSATFLARTASFSAISRRLLLFVKKCSIILFIEIARCTNHENR